MFQSNWCFITVTEIVARNEKKLNVRNYCLQVMCFIRILRLKELALINRAGGLYVRILTEVVSTDRT